MATAPLRQVGLLEQFLFKISGLQKGAMLHMQSGDNYFHQKGIMESKGHDVATIHQQVQQQQQQQQQQQMNFSARAPMER